MGRDFEPYDPRQCRLGTALSAPSPILEFPVSWFLNDFPAQEYVAGKNTTWVWASKCSGVSLRQRIERRRVLTITVRPQLIGPGSHHHGLRKAPGIWHATLSERSTTPGLTTQHSIKARDLAQYPFRPQLPTRCPLGTSQESNSMKKRAFVLTISGVAFTAALALTGCGAVSTPGSGTNSTESAATGQPAPSVKNEHWRLGGVDAIVNLTEIMSCHTYIRST